MKLAHLIALTVAAAVLGGCASRPEKTAEDVAATVGDGIIDDRIRQGDADPALPQMVKYNKNKKDRAIKEAFNLGQLQATKSLAAAIQQTQNTDLPAADAADNTTHIPLTIPERKVDGVIINAGVENVRVHN